MVILSIHAGTVWMVRYVLEESGTNSSPVDLSGAKGLPKLYGARRVSPFLDSLAPELLLDKASSRPGAYR